ncbi:hypothetical protein FACS1894167_12660 [Synergistales bacterium]|nr:hypothetical protein FACS1894167_12660 [Synergistales bacterium]
MQYTAYKGNVTEHLLNWRESSTLADKPHMSCMTAYNDDPGIKDVTFVMNSGFCGTAGVSARTPRACLISWAQTFS